MQESSQSAIQAEPEILEEKPADRFYTESMLETEGAEQTQPYAQAYRPHNNFTQPKKKEVK